MFGSIRTGGEKKQHHADKIHLQDRCPDQNHRPLVYDLCPAQSGSALLCNHSSCCSSPCSPHSHHTGLFFWALPYSGSFVLLVILCLLLFWVLVLQTSAQLSLPQGGISWRLSKMTSLPFAIYLLLLYQWFSKCVLGTTEGLQDPLRELHEVKTSFITVVNCNFLFFTLIVL